MAFEESLRGLGWKGRHEAVVRMRQVHRQVVRVALDAGPDRLRLAEFRPRFARRMAQRHNHLLAAEFRLAHVVLHNRVAARVPVLGSESLEDTLGRVPLCSG